MFFCLAPMDGITDAAYRKIVKDIFKNHLNKKYNLVTTTEFISADGFYKNPIGVSKAILNFQDQNINDKVKYINIVQIFGGNEESLIYSAKRINNNLNYDLIELNIGCPSPKICSIGGGSALMKNKKNTLKLIENLSKITNGNFSIKTRCGLDEYDKTKQLEFLKEASKYCKIITVHGRTFKQGHSGPVDRNFIYKVREISNPKCKIIGNGGIKSYIEIYDKINNLDGISIGQASIGNPWIFTPYTPDLENKKNIIIKHLNLLILKNIYRNILKINLENLEKEKILNIFKKTLYFKYDFLNHSTNWEKENKKISELLKEITNINFKELTKEKLLFVISYSIKEFRKHLFAYLKGLPNSKQLKQEIIKIEDYSRIVEIIKNIKI